MLQCVDARNVQPGAGSRWFAVQTRHHHEKTVAVQLLGKGFHIYLPTYEATRLWTDRWKRLTLPLFPGYLFLANEIDRRLQVLSTPGVWGIVSAAKIPSVITNEEIQQIQRMLDSGLPVEPHAFLNEGDRVRIKAGPLAGLEGILSQKRDGLRLVVSIPMLGRSAAVLLQTYMVERASSPGPAFGRSRALALEENASGAGRKTV